MARITKTEIVMGLNAKGEQVSRPEMIAGVIRAAIPGLEPVRDKHNERVLICPHIASVARTGGRWPRPMEHFQLSDDVRDAMANPGQTWSGKINACEKCAEAADAALGMVSGMKAIQDTPEKAAW
jgi:hypothetical protein